MRDVGGIGLINLMLWTVEDKMTHFKSLILQQLITAHKLTLVLTDLVKFLVPGFKATQQLLSLKTTLHFPLGL